MYRFTHKGWDFNDDLKWSMGWTLELLPKIVFLWYIKGLVKERNQFSGVGNHEFWKKNERYPKSHFVGNPVLKSRFNTTMEYDDFFYVSVFFNLGQVPEPTDN